MTKILNFGSLNNDKIYHVTDFVNAKETILANGYDMFCGGKGLNQSIAVASAGHKVYHAGAVGDDGAELKKVLIESGVDISHLATLHGASGHAVIQVNLRGENCIIVCSGTNSRLSREYIDSVLSEFSEGDFVILQNEINEVPYIIERAKALKMKIVFNPSPITKELCSEYPLHLVDYFVLNEVEGEQLCGKSGSDEEILQALKAKFNNAAIVLTVGRRGALYFDGEIHLSNRAYEVPVVDTTAAGDTFCGYFVASLASGKAVDIALKKASVAASICVSKLGASPSIPKDDEVEATMGKYE